MIQKNEAISSKDFSKGLVTRSDIIKNDPNQSPNCMDIKWYFDGVLGKRYGASTTNSVAIASNGAAAGFIVQNSLTNNLLAYWKMDEPSGLRKDSYANDFDLNPFNSPISTTGIRGNATNFVRANSQMLYMNTASFGIAGSDLTISMWVYLATTGADVILVRNNNNPSQSQWEIRLNPVGALTFSVLTDNGSIYTDVSASSIGNLQVGTWYNVVAWNSNGTHMGVSVNLSVNTTNFVGTHSGSAGRTFTLGATSNGASTSSNLDGRIDEVSIWNRSLSLTERQQLYANGSGNTYTGPVSPFGWAMFDFGASSIRWLTVAAGTGIVASSNLGATFVTVATSRTQTYQSFQRSKNVLIATSDLYDVPLYWAGSATTFAQALAINSAPSVKYSINYQGFLILLNSLTRKRGFFYADENLQLTDPWTSSFDLPSSADDEITVAFVLYKFLYISTRYKIFRVAFVGGNPDWSYLEVKTWGFVPRTARLMTLKGSQVVVGLDWQKRLRVFDGFDDLFISDNVENNNNYCDFAMSKISYAGSGLVVSHAEFDSLEQEYRLNVAIGVNTLQTTHAIVLNGRNFAVYPYANQLYQAMCIAESANQQHLMAVDRSGFVHILNSGNLDVSQPINDVFDSPLLYQTNPTAVHKSQQLNTYFNVDSVGTIYHQDRVDMSNVFQPMRTLKDRDGNTEIKGTEKYLQALRTVDVPATYNTYQFRITSSAGTANPWKMTRYDFLQDPKGLGRGV